MPAVIATADPAEALRIAQPFLTADPIGHTLALTILEARIGRDTPGRYWCVRAGTQVAGYAYQSPLDLPLAIFPMDRASVTRLVDAIEPPLPGVIGEAATTAAFAGRWTETHDVAGVPVQGQRLYCLDELRPWADPPGRFRPAEERDRPFLLAGAAEFARETGMSPTDASDVVAEGLAGGRLWVWEDGEAVAMARDTPPAAGVARIGWVFTPAPRRGHGYGTACVGHLCRHLGSQHVDAVLYADLSNPTSNRLYRRLGFRVVYEVLRYRFE